MTGRTGTKTLSPTDLADIVDGACLYGAGGGGPISLGTSLVQLIVQHGRPVVLAPPDELMPDDSCCVSAGVGSPDAAASGFAYDTCRHAVDALARVRGKSFTHVMPAELGAANSILPMTVAAAKGIPILDAAGSYRAVPQIMQSTFATRGLPIGTVVLANADQDVYFSGGEPATTDATMRAIISGGTFTQDAGVALWAMDGSVARGAGLPGTTESARRLGAALRTARSGGGDPVAAVCQFLGGTVLIRGTIAASTEQTGGGLDVGVVEFRDSAGLEVRVLSLNENLVAWTSSASHPAALAPDLIVFLTADGQPFSNADLDLAKGKEVVVIVAPADPAMRDPAMIAAFLPVLRATGYGGPWVGVEDLARA
jgi:hypothetical protein